MTFPYEVSLIAKVLWSAGFVIGLTMIAERVSTQIAGILSGAPLNSAFLYLFVGLDMGEDYVISSIPHGISAFAGTLAFVLSYYFLSRHLVKFSAIASTIVSIAVFVAVGFVLAVVPFTLASATVTTLCCAACAIWLFRHITFVKIAKPVRYTARLLVLRGSGAGLLIVSVATLATFLGTRWTGVLAGFPATLLPTLLIMHLTYGKESTHAIIRNFPVGMGSIIVYIFSIAFTFPQFGVIFGTIISLMVSMAYLSAFVIWAWARRLDA